MPQHYEAGQPVFTPPRRRPAARPGLLAAANATALALILAAAYFMAASMGLGLVAKPGNIAVFWPASGIGVGVLLAFGRQAAAACTLAIVVATVAANLINAAPIEIAVVFAVANAVESLAIAGLLVRMFGAPFGLDDIARVVGFMAATALGCGLSASIVAAGLTLLGGAQADLLEIVLAWFKADAVGVIVVAPLLIGLHTTIMRPTERLAAVEGLVVLSALIVAGTWVLLMRSRSGAVPLASPAVVVFPLLLWLAARTPPVFSAAASFAVASIIVVTLVRDIGRFGDPSTPLDERILAAQLAIAVSAFCALSLSALFEERRRAERRLREREAQLHLALETGRLAAFEWVPEGEGAMRVRIKAASDTPATASHRMTSAAYFATIDPEDRARVAAMLRSLTPAHPSYTVTYRYRSSPDRTVWLEESGTMDFDASGAMVRLTGLSRDVTERVHANEQQRRLIGELNHRVKNILHLISIVIDRSRERYDSVDGYVGALRGRIGAMTRTHTRLSRAGWSGVGLAEIIGDELAPYASPTNVTFGGPALTLKPEAAQAMTLVLHELATNAAKYGALAAGVTGTVHIGWQLTGPEHDPTTLQLIWQEKTGRPVQEPAAEGYGLSMIRNLLRHELDGAVDLAYRPPGLRCEIRLPVASAIDLTL